MNNEIKEIERILATSGKYITYAERCYVLDYITNLQEKYERMKENAKILSNGYNDLEKRNEKAIEYNKQIIKALLTCTSYEKDKVEDMLYKQQNILQGEDKDE